MEQTRLIKIFLASPSDVKTERELIFSLRDELNLIIGRPHNLFFEFVNWEKNSYPGIGDDAQDVINQNINEDYDIFLGIFWLRFGTKTNRAESGTKEEFEIALRKYRLAPDLTHIMLYFKTEAPQNIYDVDYEQFNKVKEFKTSLKDEGVLYSEFESINDLKSLLLLHLSSLIKDKYADILVIKEKEIPILTKNDNDKLDKYDLIAKQIDEGQIDPNFEEMLDLLNQSTDSMAALPQIMEKITQSANKIASNFNDKTKQLKLLNNVKDERYKIKKVAEISNKIAIDLDTFSDEIDYIVPTFSDMMGTAVESYTKLIMTASNDNTLEDYAKENIENVYPEIMTSIEGVLDQVAGFMQELSKIKSVTTKFSESKRRAELSTNNLFKEFIKARKILKQLEQ